MLRTEQLKPIYTATKSLNVNYTFEYCMAENATVFVPGADTHAILFAGCENLLPLRNSQYKTTTDKINFATAAVTFLYTDTTTEEGSLGDDIEQKTFFVNTKHKNRILSSMDFYTQPTTQQA